MPPTTDEKLDALLGAVAQLTTVVGSLAQQVAHKADPGAGDPPPTTASDPGVHFELTQDDPYLPLVAMDDENVTRRTRLAAQLGVLGHPSGAELIEHGARGFYRKLDRDEGRERIEFPRDIARELVEDALLEDPREAADMGCDLLKFWDAEEQETFAARGAPDVLADTKAGQ